MRLDYRAGLESVGVPAGDIDICMAWAFGPDWRVMPVHHGDEVWNSRHSDYFIMKGSDEIRDAIGRVGQAYLKMKKESTERR